MNFNIREDQQGDKRIKKKFAWWPTRIGLETIIWWERYLVEEKFFGDFLDDDEWRVMRAWQEKKDDKGRRKN